MKLTKEFIDKYLADFHYELTREQLEQDWKLEEKPYSEIKNCWNFRADDGCWLEVDDHDIQKAFIGGLIEPGVLCGTDLKTIGKEEYNSSSFCAGVEYEKRIAIKACKKLILAFNEHKDDQSFNYMKLFKENL